MVAWATKAQARLHWPDAPADDTSLDDLLDAAFVACAAYAPPLRDRAILVDLTSGSALIGADLATFTDSDVGRPIAGTGIPAGTVVMYVFSAVEAAMSAPATASAVASTATISGVPDAYVLANIYQAREIRAAIMRGESDVIGIGDYAIRARPLTAAVRQLLRPRRPSFRNLA